MAFDRRLDLVLIEIMTLLSPSYLKQKVGEVLDEAIDGKPQFVQRGGAIVMLSRLDLEIENRPPGYFKAAYKADPERDGLERAMAKVQQRPDR